jgi:hypothetical protein
MARRNLRIKVVRSTPCSQLWSEMAGDARARLCTVCNRQVHNLAVLRPIEIETLIRESSGGICAQIAYGPDGAIRTAEGFSQPSVAAGMVLAASLAFSGTALAQTESNAPKATLTGSVLLEDGTEPFANAVVGLRAQGQTILITHTDAAGSFTISAPPGHYDISIGRNVFFGVQIYGAELHEGVQTLAPVKFSVEAYGSRTLNMATGGVVVATYKYPISYLFKHPILYFKNIRHQI